jgi:hypothetical protein
MRKLLVGAPPVGFLLASCTPESDPCPEMCASAAALYGGCLADWGADWMAAAYADEDDFLDACDTWAFEMRELEGEQHEGETSDACVDRAAVFSSEEAACDDFTGLDWSLPPWEEPG